jgi:soluble lytic murein transglycosylase-like protein
LLESNLLMAAFLCFYSHQLDLREEAIELSCRKSERVIARSQDRELDPFVAYSLIYHESRWEAQAVSRAGACGLTQVVPKWTGGSMTNNQSYSCEDLMQPKISIRAGLDSLLYWKGRAGNEIARGVCAYNAGNSCLREGSTVSRYARSVMSLADRMRGVWQNFVAAVKSVFFV